MCATWSIATSLSVGIAKMTRFFAADQVSHVLDCWKMVIKGVLAVGDSVSNLWSRSSPPFFAYIDHYWKPHATRPLDKDINHGTGS